MCLIWVMGITSSIYGQDFRKTIWSVGDPILSCGPPGTFSEVSVKDPSIIFFQEMWHLFFTARSQDEYTTGYVSAKELQGLRSAPRHELNMIRGKTRYGCAPQVFYYEPQGQWYLIFQNRDSNYQPAFSTSGTISKPASWSKPGPLIKKDEKAKWIDFWIICDQISAYLFYTQVPGRVIVRTTSLDEFPGGWSESKVAFDGVHEAVHIYKVKGVSEFHMIYELNQGGIRSFGLAVAQELSGPWKKLTDHYATGNQLKFAGQSDLWTQMVSHGEVLRSGYDQQMEYNPKTVRWLIQGIMKNELENPYQFLPWQLGIMSHALSEDHKRDILTGNP